MDAFFPRPVTSSLWAGLGESCHLQVGGQSAQLADTDPASVSGESLAIIQCDHLSVAFDLCRSPVKRQHRQQQALAWI